MDDDKELIERMGTCPGCRRTGSVLVDGESCWMCCHAAPVEAIDQAIRREVRIAKLQRLATQRPMSLACS